MLVSQAPILQVAHVALAVEPQAVLVEGRVQVWFEGVEGVEVIGRDLGGGEAAGEDEVLHDGRWVGDADGGGAGEVVDLYAEELC